MIHHYNYKTLVVLVLFTVPFYHFLFSRYLEFAERHFSSDILVPFPDSGVLYSRDNLFRIYGTGNISPRSFTFGQAFHRLPKPPFSWYAQVTIGGMSYCPHVMLRPVLSILLSYFFLKVNCTFPFRWWLHDPGMWGIKFPPVQPGHISPTITCEN